MKYRWLAVVAVLVVFVGALLAQDDEGNVNDPGFNPRANACFAGGSLEGKCHTTDADFDGDIDDLDIAFMWWCGWFKIRVEYRHIPPAAAPAGCHAVLTTPPAALASGSSSQPACSLPDTFIGIECLQGECVSDNFNVLDNALLFGTISISVPDVGAAVMLKQSADDTCPRFYTSVDMWEAFVDWYESQDEPLPM